MAEEEHAFTLKNGQYRFYVTGSDDMIRVFIEGEEAKECYLRLSADECQKMGENFISLSKLFI